MYLAFFRALGASRLLLSCSDRGLLFSVVLRFLFGGLLLVFLVGINCTKCERFDNLLAQCQLDDLGFAIAVSIPIVVIAVSILVIVSVVISISVVVPIIVASLLVR